METSFERHFQQPIFHNNFYLFSSINLTNSFSLMQTIVNDIIYFFTLLGLNVWPKCVLSSSTDSYLL